MSLKGLTKKDRPTVDDFIKSAPNRYESIEDELAALDEVVPTQVKSERKAKYDTGKPAGYKPVTVSLTEGWNGLLDDLSLRPKRFRASRSDIIKVGLMMASRLSPEQLTALIKESRDVPEDELLADDFIAPCDAIPELLKIK